MEDHGLPPGHAQNVLRARREPRARPAQEGRGRLAQGRAATGRVVVRLAPLQGGDARAPGEAHGRFPETKTGNTYLKDFENRNADEVVKDVMRVLFPPGRQEQTSVYGIPTYNGGSVESWMEEILFLDSYNRNTWPLLSEMETQWKGNRRRASDILKELNGMVLKGTIPAVWFVM